MEIGPMLAFIIGLFLGACAGLFVTALLAASSRHGWKELLSDSPSDSVPSTSSGNFSDDLTVAFLQGKREGIIETWRILKNQN